MYQIKDYKDMSDLVYKVASDPTVIRNLASFAHMLGIGWCGGTQSGRVGEGFDINRIFGGKKGRGHVGEWIAKLGDSYTVQAHYDRNDPHAGGYWADKRLEMMLTNFRFLIDPDGVVYGKPRISNLEPSTISYVTAVNRSDKEETVSKSFTYQLSDTISHTTSFSFKEGTKVGIATKVGGQAGFKIPFLAEGKGNVEVETSAEFSFEATQGWSNATSTTHSKSDTQQYTAVVPPRSKRTIKLIVATTESEVEYTADISIDFVLILEGFLKWGGNARKDHPKNRPRVNLWFGEVDERSAFEDILDKYDHRHIPNYSDWDWDWMSSQHGPWIDTVMQSFRGGVGAATAGKFTRVQGVKADIIAENPEPLSEAELRAEPVATPMMAQVMAPEGASRPAEVPPHLILQSDELPGGRVEAIE